MIVKDGGLVRAALGAVDLILIGVTLQVEDFRDLNRKEFRLSIEMNTKLALFYYEFRKGNF